MKNNDPKIISITYSMELTNEIIKRVFEKDFKQGYQPNTSLGEKLESQKEIKEVNYKDWKDHPGDELGTDIKITLFTGSIKEVDPKYNNKLWQKIASIINEHIKEE